MYFRLKDALNAFQSEHFLNNW